jgi:hypothetical protein
MRLNAPDMFVMSVTCSYKNQRCGVLRYRRPELNVECRTVCITQSEPVALDAWARVCILKVTCIFSEGYCYMGTSEKQKRDIAINKECSVVPHRKRLTITAYTYRRGRCPDACGRTC